MNVKDSPRMARARVAITASLANILSEAGGRLANVGSSAVNSFKLPLALLILQLKASSLIRWVEEVTVRVGWRQAHSTMSGEARERVALFLMFISEADRWAVETKAGYLRLPVHSNEHDASADAGLRRWTRIWCSHRPPERLELRKKR